MKTFNIARQNEIIPVGYVCMKEGCGRYGLVTIVYKREEVRDA
jgi:hypothetical protein